MPRDSLNANKRSAWQGPKPSRDNSVGVTAMKVAMIRESDKQSRAI
jgi:hypothetical protein